MAYILTLDCSSDAAFVVYAHDEKMLSCRTNNIQKNHAAFIHIAIAEVLKDAGHKASQMEAIAVVAGPGSYTGLRIAFATAKGLAYSLGIPLISLGSLEVLASAAVRQIQDSQALYFPMIDARRMEVFTAGYNAKMDVVLKPNNLLLSAESYKSFLEKNTAWFFGNGAPKFENILKDSNAHFILLNDTLQEAIKNAQTKFFEKNFSELYYSEPLYIKPFFDGR